MSDYEVGMQNAFQNIYGGEVIIKGCWFHFCQVRLRFKNLKVQIFKCQ